MLKMWSKILVKPTFGGGGKKLMNDVKAILGYIYIWYPVVVLYLLFGWGRVPYLGAGRGSWGAGPLNISDQGEQ